MRIAPEAAQDTSQLRYTPIEGGIRIESYGGGKSGSSRKPVEQPDNLHSTAFVKIVDLVSCGEIEGPAHGWPAILRDIYLDGTPIQNENGSLNFEGFTIEARAGTQAQSYLRGYPGSEVSVPVGTELRYGTPWTQAFTDLELSAVRITVGVAGLSQADTENGDINGYRVEYAVDLSTDGGSYETIVESAFDGKTTSSYARTHRIELPDAESGWTLRVRRLTENADSATISDTTNILDYTSVIDTKLRSPNAALVAMTISAEQFQTIPTRAYDFKWIRCRVPTNYDPSDRSYSGTWDGTFKTAWTDNPAWIFWTLATNELFGLGDVITPGMVDKWQLYAVAQYCDELVDDGKGGEEPRFTCNCYVQEQAAAWKVLQDIASVFRGMAYYAGGQIITRADAPSDPVYTYSASNVIDSKFSYSGSSRSARHTVALVSWSDQSDFGRAKVEVVEDRDGITRYGVRKTEVTAFGCTSQGQAQRVGRWILTTEMLETQTVSHGVGLDGTLANPGQIIQIADAVRAGKRMGGRVRGGSTSHVDLDQAVEAIAGDTICITLSTGIVERREIDAVSMIDGVMRVEPTEDFSEAPQSETQWAIESNELALQKYRVLSVEPKDGLTFIIRSAQHVPEKFAAIDSGTRIQIPPVTIIPPSVQPPPSNVAVSGYSVITQGQAVHCAAFTWDAAADAIYYEVQWRRDNSNWIDMPRTGTRRAELQNVLAGNYLVRVRAVNALGVSSVFASSDLTEIDGILDAPDVVSSFTATDDLVFAIRLDWGFPTGANIIQKTEIYYSETNDFGDAIKLGDFAYPQNTHTLMGLGAGQTLFFWARLVDKNGEEGDWFPDVNDSPPEGVEGSASASAASILDYLAGEITESELASALLDRIETGEDAAVEVGELITDLSVSYTIKTQLTGGDGRLYIAGVGVGIENTEGVIESTVLFAADKFAFVHPSGSGLSVPFAIDSGNVYINAAFIQDATITNAKIAAVDAAKITTGTLSASRISTGSLNFNKIDQSSVEILRTQLGLNSVSDRLSASAAGITIVNNPSPPYTYQTVVSGSISVPSGGFSLDVRATVDRLSHNSNMIVRIKIGGVVRGTTIIPGGMTGVNNCSCVAFVSGVTGSQSIVVEVANTASGGGTTSDFDAWLYAQIITR